VSNIFHCKRPLHIDSIFCRLRKSHYDYAAELFLICWRWTRHQRLRAATKARRQRCARCLPCYQRSSHSGAEVHRLSAHRAQVPWRPRVKSSRFGDNPNQSLTISINLVRGAYVMGVT
jgi:hypothetical protein